MMRHKSAEKRARQNKKSYQRNRAIKSSVKTGVQTLTTVLETKNREESTTVLKKVISTISRAASKGVLHKKTAARKISRLPKRVNKQPAFQG